MLPSLFWKLLHQLRRKMEFAGSTGTLKQAPKAILQSCSTFPSVQVTTPAPSDSCEHIPTSVQARKRGKDAPPAAPHIWIVSMKEKMCFCSSMFQMLGTAPKVCQGQGQWWCSRVCWPGQLEFPRLSCVLFLHLGLTALLCLTARSGDTEKEGNNSGHWEGGTNRGNKVKCAALIIKRHKNRGKTNMGSSGKVLCYHWLNIYWWTVEILNTNCSWQVFAYSKKRVQHYISFYYLRVIKA